MALAQYDERGCAGVYVYVSAKAIQVQDASATDARRLEDDLLPFRIIEGHVASGAGNQRSTGLKGTTRVRTEISKLYAESACPRNPQHICAILRRLANIRARMDTPE